MSRIGKRPIEVPSGVTVTVDPGRAERIVEAAEPPRFRNRNEREFAGYKDAVDEIERHRAGA